ncbi:MAG TPA: 30S ribosomal protein S4 [archaeon]|nr:30S ribosomal protein S4 [archaeon]
MGHPKKQKKKYERPRKPYDKVRIEKEKNILHEFGLRRKKEIWRAEAILRNYRRRARELQAQKDEKKEKEMFEKLKKMGLVNDDANIEDVLGLTLHDLLSRRLQTIIYKKGMAFTPKQARQLIAHGHIRLEGRKVNYPSYLVKKGEEDLIEIEQLKKKINKEIGAV